MEYLEYLKYFGIFGILITNYGLHSNNITKSYTFSHNFSTFFLNLLEYVEYLEYFGLVGTCTRNIGLVHGPPLQSGLMVRALVRDVRGPVRLAASEDQQLAREVAKDVSSFLQKFLSFLSIHFVMILS